MGFHIGEPWVIYVVFKGRDSSLS
ncbi:uncharacterized protein G2W53_043283 [Senna tora]|uniref:Uncharacterized protein n=1 Tax=Senna tora TaxID=362788 RepID=A0A834W049_9FABA|nr:uncharacterized protein G2W53_043283 [Senna tora]